MPNTNTLKRLGNGDHGVFDGHRQLASFSHQEFMDHVRRCMGGNLAGVPGPGGSQSMSEKGKREELSSHLFDVDREITRRCVALMEAEGVGYAVAFKRVLASDRSLAARYNASHRREIMHYGN